MRYCYGEDLHHLGYKGLSEENGDTVTTKFGWGGEGNRASRNKKVIQ